jgi:hypothetical protein
MCPWEKQKTLFFGGQNMESNFQQLPFVARAILGKPSSQIETKRIFSIAGILTGFVILDLVQRTWIS